MNGWMDGWIDEYPVENRINSIASGKSVVGPFLIHLDDDDSFIEAKASGLV
jgi:hypothetical protein